MFRSNLFIPLLFSAFAGLMPLPAAAHESGEDITRALLLREAIPSLANHELTAVTVQLPPSAVAAPHRHEAFVFVYVLEGRVRSQLDEGPPVDFTAGDSWIEPAGVLHSLTQNLSDSESATLLAVFVAQQGARLTTSGEIGD